VNWEAIGAIGEVIGGLAVILTLIYVARQIQQSTGAVLAANHEGMISAVRSTRHAIAQDPALADLILRGESDSGDLSEVDARRFEEFALSQFEIWEQAFLNFQKRTIDEAAWGGWDRPFRYTPPRCWSGQKQPR
jgi:hypothetical protein